MNNRRAWLCSFLAGVVVMNAAATFSHAQVELPLEGYFRPGRCMPVRIAGGEDMVMLQAEGAVPAEASPACKEPVPMLFLRSTARSLRFGAAEIPLRALEANERLVGVATSADVKAFAQELFPGQSIITIKLDPSNPLPGPAIAWELLDAIIVDRQLESEKMFSLLGGGTVVAVRATAKPDSRWPWETIGEFHLMRYDPAGPTSAIGGEAAYLPMQSWQGGQSEGFRRRIVLSAIIFALIALSTLLIRGWQRSAIAILVVVAVATMAIEFVRSSQPAIHQASGNIHIRSDRGISQLDDWNYMTCKVPASGKHRADPWRPIVFDYAHAEQLHLMLHCDGDSSYQWQFDLPPRAQLAFLSRQVVPITISPPLSPMIASPMHDLARQAYLRQGMHISGEIIQSDMWNTVFIDADSKGR